MERLGSLFTLFILAFGLLCPVGAAASVACSEQLNNTETQILFTSNELEKIKSPESLYIIKPKIDSRFNQKEVSKEALTELFQMLGYTQNENSGEKLTLEKGTLFLARKIDELVTIQAEYVYDKPKKNLHLIQLSIVNSKNGQTQSLTKLPLDYTGQEFLNSKFNVVFEKDKAKAEIVSSKNINIPKERIEEAPEGQTLFSLNKAHVVSAVVLFPPSITGESFDKLVKWSLFISHLDHSEITVVDSVNKHRWAITKGQFRRALEFAKDRFFKQAVGFVIVYYLFDNAGAISQDITKYIMKIIPAQESSVSVSVQGIRHDGTVINGGKNVPIALPPKKEPFKETASGAIP